jgi:hypothetical protein
MDNINWYFASFSPSLSDLEYFCVHHYALSLAPSFSLPILGIYSAMIMALNWSLCSPVLSPQGSQYPRPNPNLYRSQRAVPTVNKDTPLPLPAKSVPNGRVRTTDLQAVHLQTLPDKPIVQITELESSPVIESFKRHAYTEGMDITIHFQVQLIELEGY